MKKALVVLLLLAFVGGGLFAQVVVTGNVNTGLGALKIGDGDLGFGMLAKDSWVDGMRANINFAANNSDNTVGFRGRIRATGAPVNATWNGSTQVRRAYGYVKGLGGLLELQGGRIDSAAGLGAEDGVWGENWYDSYGLLALLSPASIAKIGLGAKTNNTLNETKTWSADALTAYIGVGLDLGVVAANIQSNIKSSNIDATVSASFGVGDVADIGVGGYFFHLNDYSKAGEMFFMASADLGIVQGLDLWLGGIFGMKNGAANNFMGFGAELGFAIGGVKPGLAVAYISGGDYAYDCGLAFGQNWYNYDFSNSSYLTINPSVLFAKNVELGALINLNMNNATQGFGAYVDYRVSF